MSITAWTRFNAWVRVLMALALTSLKRRIARLGRHQPRVFCRLHGQAEAGPARRFGVVGSDLSGGVSSGGSAGQLDDRLHLVSGIASQPRPPNDQSCTPRARPRRALATARECYAAALLAGHEETSNRRPTPSRPPQRERPCGCRLLRSREKIQHHSGAIPLRTGQDGKHNRDAGRDSGGLLIQASMRTFSPGAVG